MSRENWILQMYDLGERGVKDFGSTAKKIIPASKTLIKKTSYGPRLKKLNPKLDVRGYDLPRCDIKILHLKNKKIVRVGSDNIEANIKDFKRYILPYINNAFTNEELRNLDIYIEYPSKNISIKFGGISTGWESNSHKKFSIIDLATRKDVPTAVHEVVHALKYEKYKPTHDVSKDEAETELETYIRLNPKMRKKVPCHDGYYYFVKGDKCKARKADVKIIESSCNIKNRKGLTKCIEKNLHKTNIGKLKIPKKYILQK
jgi:hypothetical protein